MTEQILHVRVDIMDQFKQAIIAAFDNLARSGLLGASEVDISVRIPEAASILASPPQPIVEGLSASDILEITLAGRVLHRRGRPSFSTQMHLAIYAKRPDVNAVIHAHVPMATILGICDLPIPPVTIDTVPFLDLPRIPIMETQDGQWAQSVAMGLGKDAPAALLLHHGIVVVGDSLQQAIRRTLSLEETARILVFCHLLQRAPGMIGPEALEILKHAGI